MISIGPLNLSSPVLLAPVAGYFDLPNRQLVREIPGICCSKQDIGGELDAGDGTYGGAGMTCTELLCPHAMLRDSVKTCWMAEIDPLEKPACMQIYGSDPQMMADAARWAEDHGAAVVDINMGCPVDKVTKKNGGSMLLCDPHSTIQLAERVVRATRIPVTCKLRLGWDDDRLVSHTLAPALCDVGVQMIIIHGRTTQMRFQPSVRLDGIARTVEAVKSRHPHIAVIGNGDITSPRDALHMTRHTGCDGVMIARGAFGAPWILRDCAYALKTGKLPAPMPRAERARIVLSHFNKVVARSGERVALNTMRKRTAKYSPHLQPWPGLRRALQPMTSIAEVREYFQTRISYIEQEDMQGVMPAPYIDSIAPPLSP